MLCGFEGFMKKTRQFAAVIEREDDAFVALCPELDIASQGGTVEEARQNLVEAIELFFESASAEEVQRRTHDEVRYARRGRRGRYATLTEESISVSDRRAQGLASWYSALDAPAAGGGACIAQA